MKAQVITVEDDSLFLMVSNDGVKIVSTNYYQTERGQKGVMFVSWNAGVARILTPKALEEEVRSEIKLAVKADLVLDATGKFLNFYFNDGQPQEYSVLMQQDNSDREVTRPRKKERTEVLVYTESYGLIKRCPLYRLP